MKHFIPANQFLSKCNRTGILQLMSTAKSSAPDKIAKSDFDKILNFSTQKLYGFPVNDTKNNFHPAFMPTEEFNNFPFKNIKQPGNETFENFNKEIAGDGKNSLIRFHKIFNIDREPIFQSKENKNSPDHADNRSENLNPQTTIKNSQNKYINNIPIHLIINNPGQSLNYNKHHQQILLKTGSPNNLKGDTPREIYKTHDINLNDRHNGIKSGSKIKHPVSVDNPILIRKSRLSAYTTTEKIRLNGSGEETLSPAGSKEKTNRTVRHNNSTINRQSNPDNEQNKTIAGTLENKENGKGPIRNQKPKLTNTSVRTIPLNSKSGFVSNPLEPQKDNNIKQTQIPGSIKNTNPTIADKNGSNNFSQTNKSILNKTEPYNNKPTILNSSLKASHHSALHYDNSKVTRFNNINDFSKGTQKFQTNTNINNGNNTENGNNELKSGIPGPSRSSGNPEPIIQVNNEKIYIEKNTIKTPIVTTKNSKEKNGASVKLPAHSTLLDHTIKNKVIVNHKSGTLSNKDRTMNILKESIKPDENNSHKLRLNNWQQNQSIKNQPVKINFRDNIHIRTNNTLLPDSNNHITVENRPVEPILENLQQDGKKISISTHKFTGNEPTNVKIDNIINPDDSVIIKNNIDSKQNYKNSKPFQGDVRPDSKITTVTPEKGKSIKLQSADITDNNKLSPDKKLTGALTINNEIQNNNKPENRQNQSVLTENRFTPENKTPGKKIISEVNVTKTDHHDPKFSGHKTGPNSIKKENTAGQNTPSTINRKSSSKGKTFFTNSRNTTAKTEKLSVDLKAIETASKNEQPKDLHHRKNEFTIQTKSTTEEIGKEKPQVKTITPDNLNIIKPGIKETPVQIKPNTHFKDTNQQTSFPDMYKLKIIKEAPDAEPNNESKNALNTGDAKKSKSINPAFPKEQHFHKNTMPENDKQQTILPVNKNGRDSDVTTKTLPESIKHVKVHETALKIDEPVAANTSIATKDDINDRFQKNETNNKSIPDLKMGQKSDKHNKSNSVSFHKQYPNSHIAENYKVNTAEAKEPGDMNRINVSGKSENSNIFDKSGNNPDKHNSSTNNFQNGGSEKHTIRFVSTNPQIFDNAGETEYINNQPKVQPVMVNKTPVRNLAVTINDGISHFTNPNNEEQLVLNTRITDLGHLKIELVKKEGNVDVILRVQSENSQKILEQALPELRLNLTKSEIPVNDVRVIYADARERQDTAKNREFNKERRESKKEKKVFSLDTDLGSVRNSAKYISQRSNYEAIA